MELKIDQISKNFLRKRKDSNILEAVKPVSFTLAPGKITVLSGHSGSGKSTLLNMLSGLLIPTGGTVCYDGQDIYKLSDTELSAFRGAHIGLVPQGQTAIQSLTVLENVMLPYTFSSGVHKKDSPAMEEMIARAKKLLDFTGIGDLRDVMPSELSGGEMRRMAIARALLLQPEFIYADEPTGDLDEENTGIVLELFRKQAELGKTVLLVTHDKDVVEYGDIHFQMKAGELETV